MKVKYSFVLLCCIFGICTALTCDSGDFSSVCVISSPQNFTQDQVISGNSLRVNADITCTGCAFQITMSGYISVNALVIGNEVQLDAGSLSVSSAAIIYVGQTGSFSLASDQATIAGTIEGTYLIFVVNGLLEISGNISASGFGYGAGAGPCPGLSGQVSRPGGGAGYGGEGSTSNDGRQDAGETYGSSILPYDLGSGGGNGDGGTYKGGNGGGIINITTLNLNLSGYILSDGQNGESAQNESWPNAAGGGSGGSINIIANEVNFTSSSARIKAEGGNGGEGKRNGYCGGSGGGGRIWINSTIPLSRSGDIITTYGGYACSLYAYSGTIEVVCPPGYSQDGSYLYACRICGPGRFSSDGISCLQCPGGTYSNVTGATSNATCQVCPMGSYTYYGSDSCELCSTGYFNNLTGQTNCFPCAPGYIAENEGQSSCSICPAGTYSYTRDECISCDYGLVSSEGSNKCYQCDLGSVAVNNNTMCMGCPAGTYTYSYSQVCLPCSKGYVSGPNSTMCTRCPPGSYAEGNTSCVVCPAGKYSTLGSTVCTNCSIGYFSNSTNTSSCTMCPLNTFTSTRGSISCSPCPTDYYSSPGSSSCKKCDKLNGTKCIYFDYSDSYDFGYHSSINFTALAIALPFSIMGFVFIVVMLVLCAIKCQNAAKKENRRSNYRPEPRPIYRNPPLSSFSPPSVPLEPFYPPSSSSSPFSSPPYVPPSPPSSSNKEEREPKKVVDDPTAVYPPPAHYEVPSAPPMSDVSSSSLNASGSNICVVCMECPKEVVFLPCGHVATCQSCANHILTGGNAPVCVICRAPIQSTTKIYMT